MVKYSEYIANTLRKNGFTMKKAISIAPSVGLVTVVTQVQSFYGIILGLVFTLLFPKIFNEDISKKGLARKMIGAVLMFAGIWLIFQNT